MTRKELLRTLLLAPCSVPLFAGGAAGQSVQRVGMVIGIRPEKIQDYKALHADANAGVRDLLRKYNMRNFSIFIRQMDDGKHYLFGYYEYVGTDYGADMDKLATEDRNRKWLSSTDPMQIPQKGERGWAAMQEVYHNE